MKKLPVISIVGLTSVGKSEAVFTLAKYVIKANLVSGVDIISADSRQVYQGLEILTGADVPANFQKSSDESLRYPTFFHTGKIRIFGLSLIKVDQEWSAGEFQQYAMDSINRAESENRLVVIVGGTGLYHTHLFPTDQQFFIPPNPEIRQKAVKLTVTELQTWLAELSPDRLEAMNNSDRNNPRRLIRAIEIAHELPAGKELSIQPLRNSADASNLKKIDQLFIGLTLDEETLFKKIAQRVKERFMNGAVAEVAALLNSKLSVSPQASTSLGFPQLKLFLEDTISEEECLAQWTQADWSYSKRQELWWRKYRQVIWFDKQKTDWQEEFLEFVQTAVTGN